MKRVRLFPTFEEVRSALPGFDDEQHKELLVCLQSLTPDAAEQKTEALRELYPIISRCLSEQGIRLAPYGVLRKTPYHKHLVLGAERLKAFLHAALKPTRAEYFVSARTLIRFCLVSLRDRGVPVFPRILGAELECVEQTVERMFPGYLRSGLLRTVLLKRKEGVCQL